MEIQTKPLPEAQSTISLSSDDLQSALENAQTKETASELSDLTSGPLTIKDGDDSDGGPDRTFSLDIGDDLGADGDEGGLEDALALNIGGDLGANEPPSTADFLSTALSANVGAPAPTAAPNFALSSSPVISGPKVADTTDTILNVSDLKGDE